MRTRPLSLFAILNSLFILPAAFAGPRLMVISFDGLRADAVSAETTPNIFALQQSGTHAREALNDMPSATLPNHATILTGLVSDTHGLILDFDLPGTIPNSTMFHYTAAAGLRGAFFASKTKLSFLAHPDVIETIGIDGSPSAMMDLLLPELTSAGPDVFFVHFRNPDSTGHAAGWMSAEYLEALGWMDEFLGQIIAATEADGTRDTYFIITADHGGLGNNHFLNEPEDRLVPWIVAGPDIPAGQVLEQTVANVDTMPTALWLLGLEVPAGLDGRARRGLKDPSAIDDDGFLPVAPVGVPCILLASPGLFLLLLARRRAPRRSVRPRPEPPLCSEWREARTRDR